MRREKIRELEGVVARKRAGKEKPPAAKLGVNVYSPCTSEQKKLIC